MKLQKGGKSKYFDMFWQYYGGYRPQLSANDPTAPESEIFPCAFSVGNYNFLYILLNTTQLLECRDIPIFLSIYEPVTYPRIYMLRAARGTSSYTEDMPWLTNSEQNYGGNINNNNQLYNFAVQYPDNQFLICAYGNTATFYLNGLYGYKN